MPARESAFLSKDGSRRRLAQLTGITNWTNHDVAEGSGLEVRWPTSANHVFGYLTDPYAGNDRPDDPA